MFDNKEITPFLDVTSACLKTLSLSMAALSSNRVQVLLSVSIATETESHFEYLHTNNTPCSARHNEYSTNTELVYTVIENLDRVTEISRDYLTETPSTDVVILATLTTDGTSHFRFVYTENHRKAVLEESWCVRNIRVNPNTLSEFHLRS